MSVQPLRRRWIRCAAGVRVLCLAAGAAALSSIAPVHDALAQTTPGFVTGEKQALAAVRRIEADCPKRSGTPAVKRSGGWKTSHSLGRDDWLFVVDGEKLECLTAAMCGTGGCALHVISVIAGKPEVIFDEHARGWKLIRPAGAAPYVKLDMHGSVCGKAGFEECNQRLDLKTGRRMQIR
jgi:hypothetical protein